MHRADDLAGEESLFNDAGHVALRSNWGWEMTIAIQNVDTRCMASQAGSVVKWHNPACMDERNSVCGQLFSGGACPAQSARGDSAALAEVMPRR